MENYVTGAIIKKLREKKGLTQTGLAKQIGVTDKAVSKWETAKGLPDITLLEPLANALNVSIAELINGEQIINKNRSANILKSKFYVCPVCQNVIYSTGEAVVSCCGVTLPLLEAEEIDDSHETVIEKVEDEHFITLKHEMTKNHYISFISYVTGDRIQTVKLYPEQNAQARMQLYGNGYLYIYCNKHGLMRKEL